MDFESLDHVNGEPIKFNIAMEGGDYSPASTEYAQTPTPAWSEWGEWRGCDGNCGSEAKRNRVRNCVGHWSHIFVRMINLFENRI